MTKKNVYIAIRTILKRTVNSPRGNDICVATVRKAFKQNCNPNGLNELSGANMFGNDRN